jgi:peptidoglycan hydrolase-like protein with peptidoglycan-binding domain
MATAATSQASLDSPQRAWLKKMGAALDAPVTDAVSGKTAVAGAPPISKRASADAVKGGVEDVALESGFDLLKDLAKDLLHTIGGPRNCHVKMFNLTDKVCHLVRPIPKPKFGGFKDHPPLDIEPGKSSAGTFLAINTNPAQGSEGFVEYFIGDDKDTKWRIDWNHPRVGSPTAKASVTGPGKALFKDPLFDAGNGDEAELRYVLELKSGGPPPKPVPGPTPGGVDAASSCHITVTNETQVVLTFGGSGHERGNFMTPPAKKLKPGDSTTFVSVEVPNNSDKKEEGCKGHVLWQVGSPSILWRIEWDNPEQQQNIVAHSFNPPNPGFTSANFIGQGEENVPVSFTLSGEGGVSPPPPPGTGGKVEFTVIDAEADKTLEGATIQAAGKSAKTGAGGTAEMELPAGTQAYAVTADGFEENKGTIEVTSGKDADRVVFMKKGSPTKGSKITFRVIDAEADKPLDAATVEAAGKSAKTAGGGKVVLELPAGKQAYVVTADGFQENKGTIEVTSGKDADRVVFMKKGSPTKASKITFKVINAEDNSPIDDATVEAAGKSAKTAGGGKAVFELPAGKHAFVVSASGFEDNKETVEVISGLDAERTVLMKKKTPTGAKTKVKFTVTDKEAGAPISGANIKLGVQNGQTDASGVSTLETEPGSLSYLVQKEGYQDATGKVDAKPDTQTDQAVQLEKEASFNPPPESKQPTLRKGDKSADGWVEYLQKLLNKYLGKDTVPENGDFEQKTYDAVKKFQASTKPPCLVDGIVGNETWSMLRKGDREKVGVNEQDDEKGAEGRWATEKSDFVTYDSGTDELRMIAFSVGDAPIDKYKATFRVTSADKKVQKTFEKVIGAPTGPSPTGSGHMHLVKVEQMAATYGNGEVLVEAYLEEILGGDLWKGTVKVTGTAPSTKTGDIGFTVTSEKTGAPVAGANVSLASLSKTTDAAGIAVFEKAPAGKHKFTVVHKDFESASGEAEVLADASTPKAVKLKPKSGPPPSGKVGNIGFKVTDAKSGKPVADAKVTLGSLSKTSDASGFAVFAKAPAGKHPFTVSHKDFESDSGEAEVLPDTSTPKAVKLKPKSGPPPSGKTGDIGFTVIDATTDLPVSGAVVALSGKTESTNVAGIAVFEKFTEGTHPFIVNHPKYEPASGDAEVIADSSTSKEVKLKPKSGPPSGKTGNITFRVINQATGAPIPGASVSLAGTTKSTEDPGTALFENAPAGNQPFTASHKDFESASGQAEVLSDSSTSKEVKLKPKSPPPPPPPPGPKTGAVGFKVMDATNDSPIPDATVTFNGQSKATDRSGTTLFEGVAEGSHSFTVVHAGHESATGSATVKVDETTPQEVKLKPETDPKKPDHTVLKTETFRHHVNLKDTNFEDEELGHWILEMEVAITRGGVVYPLAVDWIPKIKNPANKIIKSAPTITTKSVDVNGKKGCDITFKVDVAGPEVKESSGVSWKIEAGVEEKAKLGGGFEHTISHTEFTTNAKDTWRRRFVFSGVDSITAKQDAKFAIEMTGDLVIDDDHGHDDLGIDTDWELHTYDGSPKI